MRIIVVEDEERARKGIISLIRLAQGDDEVVAQANDGQRGFELIRKLKPDLVFTDIQMPVMGGLDLIKMVREQALDTQFVIVSAYEEFEYARSAISYGVQEYIVKPIIYDDIENALARTRRALDEKGPAPARGQAGSADKLVHPCVKKAAAIVEREYARRLTQDELAGQLRVTPQYFSYLFHRDMGVGFSAYLKRFRIDVAKSLLKDPGLKISDVAAAIGYSDTKYFCRVFKSETGVSPTDYSRDQA